MGIIINKTPQELKKILQLSGKALCFKSQPPKYIVHPHLKMTDLILGSSSFVKMALQLEHQ